MIAIVSAALFAVPTAVKATNKAVFNTGKVDQGAPLHSTISWQHDDYTFTNFTPDVYIDVSASPGITPVTAPHNGTVLKNADEQMLKVDEIIAIKDDDVGCATVVKDDGGMATQQEMTTAGGVGQVNDVGIIQQSKTIAVNANQADVGTQHATYQDSPVNINSTFNATTKTSTDQPATTTATSKNVTN